MPHWRRHFYHHHHHQVMWRAHDMTQLQQLMAQCHGPPPSPLPPPPPDDMAGLQHDTATTLIVSLAQTTCQARHLGFGMFFLFFHFLLFHFTNKFVFYVLTTVTNAPTTPPSLPPPLSLPLPPPSDMAGLQHDTTMMMTGPPLSHQPKQCVKCIVWALVFI